MSKKSTTARALKAIGVQEGEAVTICMPNAPQALVMFYAVNLIGAVSNMIHPLSSEKEIEFCLRKSGSAVCLTLDQMYGKFGEYPAERTSAFADSDQCQGRAQPDQEKRVTIWLKAGKSLRCQRMR